MPALLLRSPLFYLAIGLGQGLLLGWVQSLGLFQPVQVSLAWALLVMALVAGLGVQLLAGQTRLRGALFLLGGLAVLMGGVTGSLLWLTRPLDAPAGGSSLLRLSWGLSAPLIAYIALAFILSWPSRVAGRLRYPALFQHAWNTVFILLLGVLLVAAFSLLLLLCAGLFDMLGIRAVGKLFGSTGFMALAPLLVFAMGVRMGCENQRVIGLLRGILLALCRFLLPLSAAIALLFTLALPFTGLQPVWQTGHSTAILLCLVFSNLLFINGVFQDGSEAVSYPRVLRYLVTASIPCLLLLALLAGYSSGLRIVQYGFTPQRFYAALLVLVALCYSLALLCALWPRQAVWLGNLRRSNPPLALCLCGLLVLAHSPWFNALEVSARSQLQRVLTGQGESQAETLRYLRERLGYAGVAQFNTLRERLQAGQLLDEPARSALLERLHSTEQQGPYAPAPADPQALPAGTLAWLGSAEDEAHRVVGRQHLEEACRYAGCLLWAVDLDGDAANEVLLLPTEHYGSELLFFARDGQGRWQAAGRFKEVYASESLIAAIREGRVQRITPRYQSLQVGETLYVPRPSTD